jgi:hypothetical protein
VSVRQAASAPGSAPSPAALAEPSSPSIAWEIAALDRARRALAAQDAASALESLDRLEQYGPTSNFGPEAALLRIEALDSAGRSAEARAAARHFLDRYPSNAGSERVRAFLARP